MGTAPSEPSPSTKAHGAHMPDEVIEQNKATVRRLYEACINQDHIELLPSLIAEGFVGASGERGPEGYSNVVRALKAGFPDIQFTIQELIAERDRVAVRWQWQGTHAGNFRGFAATHRRVTNTGNVIYQLRSGKVVRAWLEADRLGVLQAIGVVDPNLGKPPAPKPEALSSSP
jgi:predicted ester cyclase